MSDKILIVEDDAILAIHLKKVLTTMGYDVLGFVASGEEAVRFAFDLSPDLVLMDIRLKGKMTGIEAATKISERINIPIIFLTAYTDQTVLSQIKTSASYGYLSKPVRETELKASIDIAIYKNRTDKTLKNLNQILRASKEINRLIVNEKDPNKIFSSTCGILVSSKEFDCACFAKFDNSFTLQKVASAFDEDEKSGFTDQLLLQLLNTDKLFLDESKNGKSFYFTFDDPDSPQKILSVKTDLINSLGAVIPLKHQSVQYGFLIVANKKRTLQLEEIELIEEIADDIAFALWNIDQSIKKLKTEENLIIFAQALEQSPALIIITDLAANIQYVNPAFSQITGYNPEEVLGKNPRILKPTDRMSSEYTEFWKALTSGKQYQIEFKNRKKNGSYYWASAMVGPIKNATGEITHYLGIQQDITTRKELEIELEKALEKAEAINTLKSNLLGNLNHEIRTPMNVIIGFAQILKEEIKDEMLSDMADKISKSSHRLLNTLSLILDLSELESGTIKINLTDVVVSNFVPYVLSAFKQTAEEKKLALFFKIKKENIIAKADERLLTQIMRNLVDNAIKYTESGSVTVKVDEETDSNENKFAVITVEDTGEGIPEESLNIIFEEFRQASEGITRRYQGTGLGLTIAKKMLTLLNGKIEVESNIGKGSTFKIILPCESKLKDNTIQKSIYTKEVKRNTLSPKPNIFVVEDNNLNVEVMKHFIKDVASMDFALTSKNAMEKINSNNYDILLFDIKLGQGISGIELMKEVRKLTNYKNTPIVAITGYTESEDQANFINLGFSHYLAKPFSKKQIVDLIEKIIQG